MASKHQPLVRTEKHALACCASEHADLQRTVDSYRKLVRALAGVIFVHFKDIPRDQTRMGAIERLFHKTTDNPAPRYEVINRMFHKFPSYLRRAAVRAAYGAVSSFISNYARWQSGIRSKRTASPPSFARSLEVNPPLYGGNCIIVAADWGSVKVKAQRADGTWGWTGSLKVLGKLRRLLGEQTKEELCPSLIVTGRKAILACPVEVRRRPWAGGDVVCSVDCGINTAATCAIVDSVGTVRATKFLNLGRHNDLLDKHAARIRVAVQHTLGPKRLDKALKKVSRPGKLSAGFCKMLYRRVGHLNRAAAQQTANAILAFAQAHGATSVVFEDLKFFRPKGGKHNSGLKQRFHRWLHRLLVQRAALKCEEQGIKVAYVYPRGTSSWAFDGSGEVKRNKENYALALFASGKRYNADLNAALNIAARFIAKMLGVTTGDRPAAEFGKSSDSASRMPIVLADVWRHAGAPVYEVH